MASERSVVHAQYFPTLTTLASFSRSRTSGNLNTTPVNTTGTGTAPKPQFQSTIYSLPLEASWEPDLWGKVRNTVHEAQYAAQVSAADLESERLTEQASLADFFLRSAARISYRKTVLSENLDKCTIGGGLAVCPNLTAAVAVAVGM